MARTAGALFLLAGCLALAGVPMPESRDGYLLAVAVADFAVAAAAYLVPWHRMHRRASVAIALAGLVVLAVATYAFGGAATGTGPFFVLLFAWLGLHHPPWVAVALLPLTTSAYVLPLLATGQPAAVVSSAVVFVPVTTAVAVVIGHRVGQLNRARAQVEAAERWRAALMVTLAHDVRAPLTTVQGALELLQDEDLPAGRRESLTASALRQTARINRLAGGLLDLGRIEDGVLRLDRRPVALRQAAEHAAELVPPADTKLDVDPELTVPADPERLEQILVNLISNAALHGRPPIVISGDRAGGEVRIAVRDHGAGVPAAVRDGLFSRFAGDAAGPDSVGLGLWIVRQLARAHGGDVHYEQADPGACFVVTLPAG